MKVKIEKEAAELYAKEKSKEAIGLARKTEEAKTFEEKSWEERLQNAFDCNQRLISERDRLREEVNKLQDALSFGKQSELIAQIDSLKEENERLEGMLTKSGEALSVATDEFERLKEEFHQMQNISKTMEGLWKTSKQFNSELVAVLKEMDNAFTVAPSSWLMTKEVLDASLKMRKLLLNPSHNNP